MKVRDHELLELLRDKPELLAIADAVAETQPRPKRNVFRRKWPRFVSAAAVGAAAVVVIVVVLSGGGRHGIVDRALAAIGHGRVLHVVTRTPSGVVFVDLKTGRRTVEMTRAEAWYDLDTKHFHLVLRLRGRVADVLFPEDANKPGVSFGSVDPAFTGLVLGYREALANGSAKLERRGVVDGRAVYWLRFPSVEPRLPGTEVAIDTRSYKPVLFREYFSRSRYIDEHVLVAETIPFRASEFTRRGPSLLEGTSESRSSSSELPAKPPVVTGRWLTAGGHADGLKLSAVNPMSVSTNGKTIHGVELVYGRYSLRTGTERTLTVQELPRPDQPATWTAIPRGSVAIQEGESSGTNGTHKEWTGYIVKDGIYVTIETRRSEQAVLDVARALHRGVGR